MFFIFYIIYPMNNTKGKLLAALAWVMLFANIFLPIGVVFAEEGAPIVPEQVKSQETEKVSNEQLNGIWMKNLKLWILDEKRWYLPND